MRLSTVASAEAASALHMQMIEAIDALFEEGNPVGIKAAPFLAWA